MPEATCAADVEWEATDQVMSMALRGREPLLEGVFPQRVLASDCCWWLSKGGTSQASAGSSTTLHVQLAKRRKGRTWTSVLEGEPMLNLKTDTTDFTAIAEHIESDMSGARETSGTPGSARDRECDDRQCSLRIDRSKPPVSIEFAFTAPYQAAERDWVPAVAVPGTKSAVPGMYRYEWLA